MVVYESLDHIGSNFLPFISYKKVNFQRENTVLSIKKICFPCTIQKCNNVTKHHYEIFALLSVKWSLTGYGVVVGVFENKGKFQTFSSKIGRGRLREVVVVFGSVRRGGRCFWQCGKLVAEERWSLFLVVWKTRR